MAHLVRPWIVRYIDPKTKKRVPKGTPGAKKVRERSAKHYAAGVAGLPAGKRVPLATDKTVAQRMLADLVLRAERGQAGIDDKLHAQRVRPLAEHLADFRRALEARGKTTKHVRQTNQHVQDAFDGCDFKTLDDVSAMPVIDWLAAAQRAGRFGATTAAYYARDLRSFFRWMVRHKRCHDNPLDALEVEAGGGTDHARRELSPDELLRVLDAARTGTKRFKGLDGTARYYLYLTACATGFRVKELAALRPESFRLDDDPPSVSLPGKRTKNRKRATQPLPSGVAAALRGYLATKELGVAVWPGSWRNRAAEALRIDLEAAGVPYVVEGDDGPMHADFHSLRHSFITMLDRAGATPAEAQKLARHSDVRLTLQRYTHHGLAGLGATVERIALPMPGADVNPLAALPRADLEALTARLFIVLAVLLESGAGQGGRSIGCTPGCTRT